MMTWHLVYTQARQEKLAQEQLQNQGYEVYVPSFLKKISHARKVQSVSAPLFPRYIFVGLDTEVKPWRVINGTRGVSHIITQNNKPVRIPSKVIHELKAQEDTTGHITLKALDLFKPGETVSFIQGAFEGLSGVIENMDAQGRIDILLNFLGRMMRISVPGSYVRQGQ